MSLEINRRDALTLGLTSLAAFSISGTASAGKTDAGGISLSLVQAHDEKFKGVLGRQVIDTQSRWCGGIPDEWDIHYANSAATFLRDAAAAYFHPQSRFGQDKELLERMKLAVDFLKRSQSNDGNVDLLSTNFNSPPDTAFTVHSVATAATLAKMHHDKALLSLLKEYLCRAGDGLVKGGIHTPNHRWVVCAALAQIHDLFPDRRYTARIDLWLAEGIDIDDEGQFTERSTAGYNAVVDNALIVTAHKLKRPELLEPVRKNLDAMAYLLHPNGEVVTEISRRQDLNTRGTMAAYWFALRYMAIEDGNGLYASMLGPLEPAHVDLARLMEYPELQKKLPTAAPIPDNYEKDYSLYGISRIRHGKTSVTIIHKNNNRWVSLRRGDAAINAVRFASSFFGKGQFMPSTFEKRQDGFYFSQELMGRYLQPLSDPSLLPVRPETWSQAASRRETSEICRLTYDACIRETADGFEISIKAEGTDSVPLAIEINLREGGELSGVTPVRDLNAAFLLKEAFAEYRMGTDIIRFGPGHCEHSWVQLRGADGKLSGPSVYLTGYTPFQHTLNFQMV